MTEYGDLPVGVCRLDGGLRIVGWNPRLERWTGRRREEVLGRPVDEVFPRTALPRIRVRLQRVLETGVPQVFSGALHGRLFPTREERVQDTTVSVADGEESGLLLVVRDMTAAAWRSRAQRAARTRAQVAQSAKDAFLTDVSHEIRTPMTSVLGYAELLLDGETSTEVREYLEGIQANAARLLTLLDGILELSVLTAGTGVDETGDMVGLLEGVVEEHRPAARRRGLELDLVVGERAPRVPVGEGRFRRVVAAMVGRALRRGGPGPVEMRVEDARNAEGTLRVRVTDTGPLLDAQEQRRLFLPFRDPAGSGAGLELAVAQRFAEQLGGTLGVDAVMAGRSLVLTLAASPAVGTAPRTEEARRGPRPFLSGKRVLVAGSSGGRDLLEHLVRQQCTPTTTADGTRALHRVDEAERQGRPFDLVVMDLHMPEMGGLEVARRLRKRRYAGKLVALMGDSVLGERQRCFEAGFDAVLQRPLDGPNLDRLGRQLGDGEG